MNRPVLACNIDAQNVKKEYPSKTALQLHCRNAYIARQEIRRDEPQISTSWGDQPAAKKSRSQRVDVDPLHPTDLLPQGEDQLDVEMREEYSSLVSH